MPGGSRYLPSSSRVSPVTYHSVVAVILFLVLRGSSLSLLLFGVFGVVVVSFFALVAWVLAVWPALSWFPPPSPPPLVVFWCFLVLSVFCWSLPPDIWLYLQRSGCHTFGMACRG